MKEPGVIVGPIAWVLGKIINVLFNIVYGITQTNSLGITIILFTIFVRLLMIPIAYKQQKSMFVMRKIQPEIQKIQDKYKGMMNDPEIQRKMSMETQRVYRENDYNMFGGCLPLIIQMPIFFGLYYIMQHPFQYIDTINGIYTTFSEAFIDGVAAGGAGSPIVKIFNEICTSVGIEQGTDVTITLCNSILNVITPEQVKTIVETLNKADLNAVYQQKNIIETFLGLNLTETVGFALNAKLILPVLSGLTTWLSSWMMSRKNQPTDPAMKSQQRIMNITMPLIMAWFTTNVPAGLGVYWVTGNIVMVVQQLILTKHFEKIEQAENNNVKKNGGKKK